MRSPPDRHKEREQEAIEVSPILNPAGFDVEASAFAVLKGGFHAHAPSIFLHLSAPSSLIADEQPRLLTPFIPDQTDIGFQRLFLPHSGFAIPAIAWLEDDVLEPFPRLLQFPLEVAPTAMLPTDAQQIVPAASLAEFDQRHPA